MRKIKNGKVYDTETARHLASAGGENYREDLYRKRTDEYFLCNGKALKPLSDDEAVEWVQMNVHREYDNIFGSQDDNSCAARIRRLRKSAGISRAEFCRKYKIPIRTVEDWEAGSNSAPEYVIDLLERVVREDCKE